MPDSEGTPGIARVDGDRGRVQQHTVQSCEDGSVGEAQWKRDFQVLCAALGRAWISSDKLVLLAHQMQAEGMSQEALGEYALQLTCGRTKPVHDFMG